MAAGTTILHKRKAGAFAGGELAAGEFGVDTTNGNVYFSANGTTVVLLVKDGAAVGSHSHGAITNAGKIGSTSGLPLKTGTDGIVEAGAFGTSAGEFCQGNDARLSDARTPTAHAHEGTAILSTGEVGGNKFLREDGDGTSSWQSIPGGGDFGIACSDESTAVTTGTGKVTFRMPYAMTLTGVRASVKTAPTGSTLIIDINKEGTSVLSTKLSIDASEKTSTTAASAAVISDATLGDDAEITIDFDQVGSTIAGAGVKIWLLGTRT